MRHFYVYTLGSVLLSLLLSLPLSAATYFAAPAGTGNGSSYASPCSLNTGISKLKNAGDTLYLLGGQYDLGNTKISSKNGSSKRKNNRMKRMYCL